MRKHAMAEHVTISLTQGRDFQLVVQDDGEGFDPSEFDGQDSAHVGLHIMQERASRLGATLTIDARPGAGVRVALSLPRGETMPHPDELLAAQESSQ